MRALPIERVAGVPSFVLGVSVVRGEPCPVVNAAALLGGDARSGARLVSLRVAERSVALRVDAVLGTRSVPDAVLGSVAPLLSGAPGRDALGALDGQLLEILDLARLLPVEQAAELMP